MYIEPGLEELVENLLGSVKPNMATMMGIEFSKLTKDECIASMPVNESTVQPFRVLHGGASVALAETLASVGAWLHLPKDKTAVGVEINAIIIALLWKVEKYRLWLLPFKLDEVCKFGKSR